MRVPVADLRGGNSLLQVYLGLTRVAGALGARTRPSGGRESGVNEVSPELQLQLRQPIAIAAGPRAT